jgi:hypothetical protein
MAIPPMLAWSLAATLAYPCARRRGLPDILEAHEQPAQRLPRVRSLLLQGFGVWSAGCQAFLFSKAYRFVLRRQGTRLHRFLHRLLLLVGLTLFGVTTAEHMLRRAGYGGGRLLRLSLIAPFLNVPYRVFLSASVAHFAGAVLRLV